MKIRDELIVKALNILAENSARNKISDSTKKTIPEKMKGYIASLGGSVVAMGVYQACLQFETSSTDKPKLMKTLLEIFKAQFDTTYPAIAQKNTFHEFIKDMSAVDRRNFTKYFTEAAVALKMAMRTFKFEDELETI